MFNNNFMGAGRGPSPMLNPPSFINPYPAQAPIGMATGGYLPQQPSPVAPQQAPQQAPDSGQTLGMANGGYLPQQQQFQQQQPLQFQQTPQQFQPPPPPINPELLSAFQAYMAQQQPQNMTQQTNNMPSGRPDFPARPAFPARAAPSQMGLGSLAPTSRMPQMPSMSGFSSPKAGI